MRQMMLPAWLPVLLFLTGCAKSFLVVNTVVTPQRDHAATSSALFSTQNNPRPRPQINKKVGAIDARRKVLFNRKTPHFALDRKTGRIEFGNTVKLSSTFDSPDNDDNTVLQKWLSDASAFAPALWRPDMLTQISSTSEDNARQHSSTVVYRMGLLPLQFVSLKFEPWVEVQCKTVLDRQKRPVFTLQSVNYNPNPTEILFIPGMPPTLTLDNVIENLKIEIEVVGQIRAKTNSVGGSMVYQVNGILPSALLFFPDPILNGAAETIGREVVKFAQKSFQTGSQSEFSKFVKSRKRKRTGRTGAK